MSENWSNHIWVTNIKLILLYNSTILVIGNNQRKIENKYSDLILNIFHFNEKNYSLGRERSDETSGLLKVNLEV